MPPVPILKTFELTKVYATEKVQVDALKDITVSFEKSLFSGIAGPSGSGKSTLLNLLGGLDTPSSGYIEIDGRNISSLKRDELALYRRQEVGMVFQSFNIISSYNALENVAFPLLFAGVPKKERLRRAENLLENVGLSERSRHLPAELSGGEQQRVAIARALVNNPKVLLADEPTGNLDSRTSREIIRLMADLNRNTGLTVIMVSHEEQLLNEFGSKIISLRDGQVVDER